MLPGSLGRSKREPLIRPTKRLGPALASESLQGPERAPGLVRVPERAPGLVRVPMRALPQEPTAQPDEARAPVQLDEAVLPRNEPPQQARRAGPLRSQQRVAQVRRSAWSVRERQQEPPRTQPVAHGAPAGAKAKQPDLQDVPLVLPARQTCCQIPGR